MGIQPKGDFFVFLSCHKLSESQFVVIYSFIPVSPTKCEFHRGRKFCSVHYCVPAPDIQ